VQIFNRKLYKIIKNKDNVRILNIETIREDFTQHGFCLNGTGKIKVVKLMSQKISQLFEAKKKHPVILKWRSTQNDPSLVNSIPKVIREDHVVIDDKGRNKDQMDSYNQGIRMSSRPKRLPNTRSDDFLWVQSLIRLYMSVLLLWLQSNRDVIMVGTLNITITLLSHQFMIMTVITTK
jgi:hypothetical protein